MASESDKYNKDFVKYAVPYMEGWEGEFVLFEEKTFKVVKKMTFSHISINKNAMLQCHFCSDIVQL